MLGHGADHVKPGGLGVGRDGFGRGALPLGDVQLRALHLGIAVVVAPAPGGHRHAHGVAGG